MYFRRAADQGLAEGQYRFGVCCVSGEGVTEDSAIAFNYFQLSSEQGNARA
jgi:TPR repeat protein